MFMILPVYYTFCKSNIPDDSRLFKFLFIGTGKISFPAFSSDGPDHLVYHYEGALSRLVVLVCVLARSSLG